jgi:hypothetical protein
MEEGNKETIINIKTDNEWKLNQNLVDIDKTLQDLKGFYTIRIENEKMIKEMEVLKKENEKFKEEYLKLKEDYLKLNNELVSYKKNYDQLMNKFKDIRDNTSELNWSEPRGKKLSKKEEYEYIKKYGNYDKVDIVLSDCFGDKFFPSYFDNWEAIEKICDLISTKEMTLNFVIESMKQQFEIYNVIHKKNFKHLPGLQCGIESANNLLNFLKDKKFD